MFILRSLSCVVRLTTSLFYSIRWFRLIGKIACIWFETCWTVCINCTSSEAARPARRTAGPSSARRCNVAAASWIPVTWYPSVPRPAASRCAYCAGLRSSVTHGIGSVTDIPQLSSGFNRKDWTMLRYCITLKLCLIRHECGSFQQFHIQHNRRSGGITYDASVGRGPVANSVDSHPTVSLLGPLKLSACGKSNNYNLLAWHTMSHFAMHVIARYALLLRAASLVS